VDICVDGVGEDMKFKQAYDMMVDEGVIENGADVAYHGTSSSEYDMFNTGVVYLVRDRDEAMVFATHPILGGWGRGMDSPGMPRVLTVKMYPGKTCDIDDRVVDALMNDDDIDALVDSEAAAARKEGYGYLSFNHPSSVHNDDFQAIVALYPGRLRVLKTTMIKEGGDDGSITIYRGENVSSENRGRGGMGYWSIDPEFAVQFTQEGRKEEVMVRRMNPKAIYDARDFKKELPGANSETDFDEAMRDAKEKGFYAVRFSEGGNYPDSIYVFDRRAFSSNVMTRMTESVFRPVSGDEEHERRMNGPHAIIHAVWDNDVEKVQELLDMGADANSTNKYGDPLILRAAYVGIYDMVELFIEYGADVNVADMHGDTPLIMAVVNAHERIVELLLDAGADVDAVDSHGRTALHWARQYGFTGIEGILEKRGAKG
jgi:hypothetical protein